MIKFSNVISYLRPQNLSNPTVCGDFNIDMGGTSSCHLNSLLQLQLDFDLTQVVNELPDLATHGPLPLILFFYQILPSSPLVVSYLPSALQITLLFQLPLTCLKRKKQTQPHMKSVWIYKAADIPLGRKLISSLPLAGPSDDIDAYWRKWLNDFLSIMEKCIPRKRVPIESKMPWINGEIRRDISKRECLFRRFKRSLSYDILQKYKSLRNTIVNKIRSAKKSFLNNLSSAVYDPKRFWSTIRRINPRPDLSSMSLMHDSISVSSISDKASLLNHFSSCFNNATVPLLCPKTSIEDASRDFDWADCTTDGVATLLKQIKPHSSVGPDSNSAWMLRTFAEDIAPSISSLFNLSIKIGKVPAERKLSNVVPIPKGDLQKDDV